MICIGHACLVGPLYKAGNLATLKPIHVASELFRRLSLVPLSNPYYPPNVTDACGITLSMGYRALDYLGQCQNYLCTFNRR